MRKLFNKKQMIRELQKNHAMWGMQVFEDAIWLAEYTLAHPRATDSAISQQVEKRLGQHTSDWKRIYWMKKGRPYVAAKYCPGCMRVLHESYPGVIYVEPMVVKLCCYHWREAQDEYQKMFKARS